MNTAASLYIGNSQGGTVAGVQGIPRSGQVEEQVAGLQVNAKDLSQIVLQLTAKLRSVTQPVAEKAPSPATPRPVLVPLASQLQDLCDDVRGSVDRLRELCGAIELTE